MRGGRVGSKHIGGRMECEKKEVKRDKIVQGCSRGLATVIFDKTTSSYFVLYTKEDLS